MSVTYRWARWLPEVLRTAGCHVQIEQGWRTRGLSRLLPFAPKAVVWHHDASPPGPSPSIPAAMIARFDTAAAQLWVCVGCGGRHPSGTWHIVAAGRAPHAGATLRGKPTNFTSLGVETDHTVGEAWDPEQLASLQLGTAAILEHLGVTADDGLEFHKTICSPPGRKIDPAGLELGPQRLIVAKLMDAPHEPMVDLSRLRTAATGSPGMAPVSTRRVQKALRAEKMLTGPARKAWWGRKTKAAYRRWQLNLGYTGSAADGVPGLASLTKLGQRHGFGVRP